MRSSKPPRHVHDDGGPIDRLGRPRRIRRHRSYPRHGRESPARRLPADCRRPSSPGSAVPDWAMRGWVRRSGSCIERFIRGRRAVRVDRRQRSRARPTRSMSHRAAGRCRPFVPTRSTAGSPAASRLMPVDSRHSMRPHGSPSSSQRSAICRTRSTPPRRSTTETTMRARRASHSLSSVSATKSISSIDLGGHAVAGDVAQRAARAAPRRDVQLGARSCMQGPVEAPAGLVDATGGEVEQPGGDRTLGDVEPVESLGGSEWIDSQAAAQLAEPAGRLGGERIEEALDVEPLAPARVAVGAVAEQPRGALVVLDRRAELAGCERRPWPGPAPATGRRRRRCSATGRASRTNGRTVPRSPNRRAG